MFLSIQTDLIILKTFNQQFTLTAKKSLHIIFKACGLNVSRRHEYWHLFVSKKHW